MVKNKKLKSFLALTCLAFIASGVIFIFQYLVSLINTFINLPSVSSPIYFLLYFLFVIGISILEAMILKPPFLKGNLLTLREYIIFDEKIHWLKGSLTVLIGCLLTFLLGLPLGGEAPSVFMVALLGEGIFHLFKNKTRELEGCYLGAGIGYSLAFINPLAGFSYYLEVEKMKINFRNFFKPLYVLLLSWGFYILWRYLAGIPNFYNYDAYTGIDFFQEPVELYICIIIPFIAILFAYAFKKAVLTLKESLGADSHLHYILSTIIALTFILLIKYSNQNILLGNGGHLLTDLTIDFTTMDLVAFLIIRFLFTSITFNLFYAGGQVIPTIALGALIGNVLVSLLGTNIELSETIKTMMIVTTMLTFYAVLNNTYFTSFFLSLSFAPIHVMALPLVISLGLAYLINHYLKNDSGLHQEILKKLVEFKKRKLG